MQTPERRPDFRRDDNWPWEENNDNWNGAFGPGDFRVEEFEESPLRSFRLCVSMCFQCVLKMPTYYFFIEEIVRSKTNKQTNKTKQNITLPNSGSYIKHSRGTFEASSTQKDFFLFLGWKNKWSSMVAVSTLKHMIDSRLLKCHRYLLVPVIRWWVHAHVLDPVCTNILTH